MLNFVKPVTPEMALIYSWLNVITSLSPLNFAIGETGVPSDEHVSSLFPNFGFTYKR